MPELDPFAVQRFDLLLQAIGLLAGAWIATRWSRTGRWRDPLADVPLPAAQPHLSDAFLVAAAYFLFMQIAVAALGRGGAARSTELLQPGTADWHRLQLTDAVIRIGLAGIMVAMLRLRHVRGSVSTRASVRVWAAGAVFGVLLAVPATGVLFKAGEVVLKMAAPAAAPPNHPVLDAVTNSAWGAGGVVALWLSAVVAAPLVEELFFRGVLLGALARLAQRKWPAVIASALLFGLIHAGQPQAVLPVTVLGLILGYVRLRAGSVTPCILLHALFNARTMAYVTFAPRAVDLL